MTWNVVVTRVYEPCNTNHIMNRCAYSEQVTRLFYGQYLSTGNNFICSLKENN